LTLEIILIKYTSLAIPQWVNLKGAKMKHEKPNNKVMGQSNIVSIRMNDEAYNNMGKAHIIIPQKTDNKKLVFKIKTDGSIHPKQALTEAAKTLIHHFMLFSDERITLEADEVAQTDAYDEESLHMRQLLKTKLVDMDLSVRALNCLKAAEVETLGDLVSFNKADLMKFRNFGKKSLIELDELVANKGLVFGMDTSKYKLDKD